MSCASISSYCGLVLSGAPICVLGVSWPFIESLGEICAVAVVFAIVVRPLGFLDGACFVTTDQFNVSTHEGSKRFWCPLWSLGFCSVHMSRLCFLMAQRFHQHGSGGLQGVIQGAARRLPGDSWTFVKRKVLRLYSQMLPGGVWRELTKGSKCST